MDRVVIAVVLIVLAVAIAIVVQRRRSVAPPTQPGWTVPAQLDRNDFSRPEAPWLVAVFTSSKCDTCRGVMEKAGLLDAGEVTVQEIEVTAQRKLHERYAIDAVPLVLIADSDGVVRAHFLGPVTATDLWARVAELREPGAIPGAVQGECQSRAVES